MPNLRKVGGAAAPFVPVTLVQENWNLGDGGSLNGKSPNVGTGVWQNDTMFYDTNAAAVYAGISLPNLPICTYSLSYINVKFQAVVYPVVGPVDDLPNFIYARYVDANNYYRVGFYPGSTILIKVIGGTTTQIGSAGSVGQGSAALQASGSTIKVFAAGSEIISVSDSSISGSGKWGFGVTSQDDGEITTYAPMGPILITTVA